MWNTSEIDPSPGLFRKDHNTFIYGCDIASYQHMYPAHGPGSDEEEETVEGSEGKLSILGRFQDLSLVEGTEMLVQSTWRLLGRTSALSIKKREEAYYVLTAGIYIRYDRSYATFPN